MKKKILSLLLIVLITFALTACDMLNGLGTGTGTQTVEVNLDEVYLNVSSQINTKDALENNITLPTKFGTVNITWVSDNPNLIDNNGRIVARPDQDTEVILNCTLTNGNDTKEYKLKVIIKAKDVASLVTLAQAKAGTVGQTYKAKAVVIATSKVSFLLKDDSDLMLVYIGADYAKDLVVGDEVEVEGPLAEYNGTIQFTTGTTYTKVGTKAVSHPQARVLDGAALEAMAQATPTTEFVKVSGTLKISGSYYNLEVEGTTAVMGSLVTAMDLSEYANKKIIVSGYYLYVNGAGKYANIIVTEVELDPNQGGSDTPQPSELVSIETAKAGTVGQTYKVKAVVIATSKVSFLLQDETGMMLVYLGTDYAKDLAVGDEVEVEGKLATYSNTLQLSNATYNKVAEKTVAQPTPRVLDGAAVDALVTATEVKQEYVQVEGVLRISGDYVNIEVEGAKATASAVTDIDVASMKDKTVVVTGYYLYATGSGKYASIITTSITLSSNQGPELTVSPISDVLAGEVGKTYKVEATVVALSNGVVVVKDNSGYITINLGSSFDSSTLSIGDKLSIQGASRSYSGIVQFNYPSYEVLGHENVTQPEATVLNNKTFDALDSESITIQYVKLEAKLAVSNNKYFNLVVEGSTMQGSIAYPANAEALKTLDGKNVAVEGYFVYITTSGNNKYAYIVATDVVEVGSSDQVATLSEALQGTYKANGIAVIVYASKVVVSEDGHGDHEYVLYIDADNQYYVLEEGEKIVCTFGDNQVTNKYGTFTKDSGETTHDPEANLPEALQGTYKANGIAVIVYASKVVVSEDGHGDHEYVLYIDADNQYYVLEEGEKIVCTFGDNSVTNKYGTFTKDSGETTHDPEANLPEALQGVYTNDNTIVEVWASVVSVMEKGSDDAAFYTIYVDAAGQYYIEAEAGRKVVCHFEDGKVSNEFGVYVKDGGEVTHDPEANLPEELHGVYRNDNTIVEVWASVVGVMEKGSENGEYYTIYVDADNQYYIEVENGRKVVCHFEDGKVSNEFGVFIKDGGEVAQDQVATLPEALQGTYKAEGIAVIVSASSVTVSEDGNEEHEYVLYIDADNQYYVLEEGEKIVCTFGDNSVTNKYGTFTKEEASDEGAVADVKAVLQKWNNYEIVMDPALDTELNGCTITWVSNNEDVMTSDGHATLQAEDTVVKFNVTVSKNDASETFEITFIVKKYDTIATLLALEESEYAGFNFFATKAVVVANFTYGFLVKDATGYIVVYDQEFDDSLTLGDEYIIRGMIGNYGGVNEFATFFKYEATGENVTLETPEFVTLDANMVARLSEQMVVTPVELKGILTINDGQYINVSIDESSFTGSVSGSAADYEQLNNKAVIVKGYLISINGQYVNIIPLEVEEDEEANPLPTDKENIKDASTATKTFEVNEDGTWTVTIAVVADEQYENPRFLVRDVVAFGFLNGEFGEDLYQEETVILQDKSNLVVTDDENGTLTVKVIVPADLVTEYTSEYYAATAEDGTCYKGGIALDLYLEFYDGEEDYSPVEDYYYNSFYFFRSFLDVVETTGDGTMDNPLTAADAYAIAAYLPEGIWTKAEFYIEGTVVGEPTADYCDFLFQVGDNTLTVYGLFTNDGLHRYGEYAGRIEGLPVKTGDKVLLLAQIYHYVKDGVSVLETMNAKLIKVNDIETTYEALPEFSDLEVTPLNGIKEGYVYWFAGYRNGKYVGLQPATVENGVLKGQVKYVCDSYRIYEYLQVEEGEEYGDYTRYTNLLSKDITECAFHIRDEIDATKTIIVNEDGTWTVVMILTANEAIADPRFDVRDVKAFGYQNGVSDPSLYLEETVVLDDKSNLVVTEENGVLTVTVTISKALVAKYASEYYLPDIYSDGTCYKGGIALDLYIEFYDGNVDLSSNDHFFGTFYCFHSFLDVVETTGDGTIENPLTAADAYALAAYLPEGVWTNDEYYIVGTVASVDPAWCNLTFQVGENTFTVFGIATADGEYKYGTTPNKVQGIPVQVGDKVLLLAQVYHYVKDGVSTLETLDAKLVQVNDQEVTYELVEEEEYQTVHAGTADDPLDGADVALIASHLDASSKEQTETRYYIEAVVAEVEDEPTSTYCNFHLVTGTEEQVLVYGLSQDEAFTQRYGTKREIATLPEGLAAGNTVVLYGYIQNYSGTFEIQKAQLLKVVVASGEGNE